MATWTELAELRFILLAAPEGTDIQIGSREPDPDETA